MNAIFIRPAHPVPLVQVPNITQFQISKAVLLHKETIGTFNLCNLVKCTIIQKINASVDFECLADLVDNEISLLTGTIPEILAFLFEMYGDNTAQTLAAKKSMV